MDSGYKVVQTSTKGRCIVATRSYQEEDTIFEEAPLVSSQFSWNKQYKYRACDHCMRSLETAEENVRRLANDPSIELTFPECCPTQQQLFSHTKCENCSIEYCSSECMIEAHSKYHKYLCLGNCNGDFKANLYRLEETWKRMHYPPETATVMLIVRIFAMMAQQPDQTNLLSALNDFQSISKNEDLMIIHKMLGENFTEQLSKLHHELQKTFETEQPVAAFLTEDGFKSIFALIGTNSQGVGTSPFADWVKNVSELTLSENERKEVDEFIDTLYTVVEGEAGTFLNAEGSALYSLQSKINHSCAPNAEIRFPHSNHVMAVSALKSITAGEEVTISYLSECDLERSRHSRQKILKTNYLFVCECSLCEQQVGEPDVTSEEEMETDGEDGSD